MLRLDLQSGSRRFGFTPSNSKHPWVVQEESGVVHLFFPIRWEFLTIRCVLFWMELCVCSCIKGSQLEIYSFWTVPQFSDKPIWVWGKFTPPGMFPLTRASHLGVTLFLTHSIYVPRKPLACVWCSSSLFTLFDCLFPLVFLVAPSHPVP